MYAAIRCLVDGGSCASVVLVAAVASVAVSVRCLVCLIDSSGRDLVGIGSTGWEWSEVDEVASGRVSGLGVASLKSCCCASASVDVD